MKKKLPVLGLILALAVVMASSVFAQTKKEERKGIESPVVALSSLSYIAPAYVPGGKDVLLNEGFEGTAPPTGWTVIDADGDTYNWSYTSGFAVHSGTKSISSASYINGVGALTPNNYLVTPQLTIPSSGTYQLKYWVNAQDAAYPGEHYKVALSTSGNAAANFTVTLFEETMTAKTPGAWYERTVDMTAYAGQTVYLAWVHYNCTDMFWLNLDDVTLMPLPTSPIAALNMNAANFNMVNVGQSATVTGFQLQNMGIGTLTASNVTSSNPEFTTSIVTGDVAVVPGTPYAFSVTYTPTNVGVDNATITITTNGGNVTIAVTGEGFQLPTGMIEIGTGTLVDTHLPLEMYYGYTYSQTIYKKSEINVANQRISKVLWHYKKNSTTAGTPFTDEIKIYMGHTTLNAITAWVPITGLVEVYSGTITIPAQGDAWIELPLTVPFNYNNVDNLIIAADENTPGYHTSTDEFLGHAYDGTTNMSIYYYSDGTNPDPANPTVTGTLSLNRPNVRLQFENVPAGPAIAVSPTALNYGMIEAGTTKTLEVTFTNTGGAPLHITGVTGVAAPFNCLTPVLTVAPGMQSSPTAITFAPTAAGAFTQTITFTSDAEQGSGVVTLAGAAYPQGILYERFEDAFPPLGWTIPTTPSWTQGTYASSAYEGSKYAYLGYNYSGKLVTPKLSIVSGDSLVFFVHNSSYSGGTLSLRYSPDMVNWTLLQDITMTGTYAKKVVDLTAAAGNNYIAFDGGYYVYLDFVMGPQIWNPGTAPEAATNPVPADAGTDVLTSTTLSWTGVMFADGYKIKLGTDNPPTNVVNGVDLGNVTQYAVSGLNYSTVYYWQVIPYNENGDCTTAPVWSFTTQPDPYITVFPYVMDFEANNGLVPPIGWSNSGAKPWSRGTEAHGGLYCARAAYSPAGTAILNTPYINLPDSMRIMFWWKDDDISYKNAARRDNKVAAHDTTWFEVSVDHGMTWTTLASISEPSNTSPYLKVTVNLAPYAGDSVLLRWRDYSDGTSSAWGIGLDDIRIEELPSGPNADLNLTSYDFGMVGLGYASASGNIFTITNTGIDVLTVTSVTGLSGTEFSTDLNAAGVALGENESVSFGFTYEPVDVGVDAVTCTIVTNGGTLTINLSGEGFEVPPFTSEDFEGDFPPVGWTIIDADGDGYNWMYYTYTPHEGTGCAASESYVNYVGALTPNNYMITPKFAVTAETNILSWWVAAQDPDWPAEHYAIFVSTTTNTPAAFTTKLFEETLTTDAWERREVDLRAYMGQEIFVAFRHYDCTDMFVMKIDDVALSGFVNTAPEFITTPVTHADSSFMYNYAAKAIDEDGDVVTYGVVTMPEWLTMEAGTNGAVNIFGVPSVVGDHQVEIYATDGTDTTYHAWTISVVTGINGVPTTSVSIYPNPVKEVVTIEARTTIANVKVYNAIGKVVAQQNVNASQYRLSVNNLTNGVYIVSITTVDGNVITKRITVNK